VHDRPKPKKTKYKSAEKTVIQLEWAAHETKP